MKNIKRRQFIQTASASLPLFFGGFQLKALPKSRLFNGINKDNDRILVLVQLNGGNDGLNTVLPIDQYDNLAKARENILIPENKGLSLTDKTALHPSLSGIQNLFKEGKLNLVQGVGYPNQNRSHFRSKDIWLSGSPAEEYWTTGWMGRIFEEGNPAYPTDFPNEEYPHPFALTMGSIVSETCQGTVANYSLALENPFSVSQIPEGENGSVPNTPYGQELSFLRELISQTNVYGAVINDIAKQGKVSQEYPNSKLGQQLKNVAYLISGGLKTKVFVVNQGGYDTHALQSEAGSPTNGEHANLLKELNDALVVFQKDMESQGLGDRVLGMTFSEFGRQIKSNASYGTDHGSAAPLMLFGSCVNAGLTGANPEIPAEVQKQEGVAMQFDFRDVYGSVLKDWFEIEEETIKKVLHAEFQYFPVATGCQTTTNTLDPRTADIPNLIALPNPFASELSLKFECGNERVDLSIFNSKGQLIKTLINKELAKGTHQIQFEGKRLPAGNYYARLALSGGRVRTKGLVKM